MSCIVRHTQGSPAKKLKVIGPPACVSFCRFYVHHTSYIMVIRLSEQPSTSSRRPWREEIIFIPTSQRGWWHGQTSRSPWIYMQSVSHLKWLWRLSLLLRSYTVPTNTIWDPPESSKDWRLPNGINIRRGRGVAVLRSQRWSVVARTYVRPSTRPSRIFRFSPCLWYHITLGGHLVHNFLQCCLSTEYYWIQKAAYIMHNVH